MVADTSMSPTGATTSPSRSAIRARARSRSPTRPRRCIDPILLVDGIDRAHRQARAAIDAHLRIDHHLAGDRAVDAVGRAHVDARLIADADALLADDVGHGEHPSTARAHANRAIARGPAPECRCAHRGFGGMSVLALVVDLVDALADAHAPRALERELAATLARHPRELHGDPAVQRVIAAARRHVAVIARVAKVSRRA